MTTPKATMSKFLNTATTEQVKAFAKTAKTSRESLRHIAAGRRGVSAEQAQVLVSASKTLPQPLRLDQRDLSRACAKCPLVSHPPAAPKAAPKAKKKSA